MVCELCHNALKKNTIVFLNSKFMLCQHVSFINAKHKFPNMNHQLRTQLF